MDEVALLMVEARGFKATLHIAVEYASGDSAVIEYVGGQRRDYHGPQHAVMTKSPPYDEQVALLESFNFDHATRETPLPGNVNPRDRFVRAWYSVSGLARCAGMGGIAPASARSGRGFPGTGARPPSRLRTIGPVCSSAPGGMLQMVGVSAMGGLAVVDRPGGCVGVLGRLGVVLVLCAGLGACQAADTGSGGLGTAGSSTGWTAGEPVATGDAPIGLVADGQSVLVVHNYAKTVVRVGADHEVTTLANGPDGPSHPPLAFGSLWVVLPNAGDPVTVGDAEYAQNAVGRLDPESGHLQAQVPAGAQFLVASPEHVWAVGERGEAAWVWRIDPRDNSVTALPEALDPGVPGKVAAVAYGRDRLWIALNGTQWGVPSRLVTVDPSTDGSQEMPARIPEDMIINDMALTDAGLALIGTDLSAEAPRGVLVLIDASAATVRDVQLGRMPTGIALAEDGLWISDCLDGTLTLVDPRTGTPRGQPVQVGTPYPKDEPWDWNREDYSCPGALTQAEHTLWVAAWNDDAIIPVQPPPN